MFVRPDSVDRIREKRDFSSGGRFASCGAIMDGRLKDAKIVRLSRMAKSAKVIFGTVAAGEVEGALNMRAKQESLYTQRLMLTAEVAINFVGPELTVAAGFAETVDWRVSTALAAA